MGMSTHVSAKDYQNYLNSEHTFRKNYEKEADYSRMCMQQCPICLIYAPIITNVHCVKEHGVSKKEVELKYGKIRAGGR